MRVGAAIVHYKFWPQVRVTLDALLAQTVPPAEVVLIENGSEDGSAELIREHYPQLDVVEVTPNLGPIGGLNRGLSTLLERDFDAVLLLTHETKLAPDALEVMVARLSESPETGAVGPLLGFLSQPDRVWSAGGRIFYRTWDTGHLVEPASVAAWRERPPHEVDWVDGACVLLRRDAALAGGLLHEDFFAMFDEAEYQLKLRELGWKVECVPAAVGWQEPGLQPPYLFVRNRLRFLARRAPKRIVAREIARVLFYVLRDAISPRPGETRSDAWRRLRGLLAFLRGRSGRPPAPLVARRAGT